MNKLLIITGLTASGKSDLAVKIAKKYNGEIISCDSVQVYIGLDIGSAKESKQVREEIKHHLIDIVEPNVNYNVSNFVSDCKIAVEDCISRNKLPIIVGGTGMYIKALLEGYSLGEIGNQDFRNQCLDYIKANGKVALWEQLNKIDKNFADKVHYNNVNRVIRYLEMKKFGEPKKTKPIFEDFDVLAIGIDVPKSEIYPKIDKRVDEMIKFGLEDEVKSLIEQGLNLTNNSMNTIGYREMYQYIKGEIDFDTCVQKIKQHTRNYAKRQLTFMKTIKELKIVSKEQAMILIDKFLG